MGSISQQIEQSIIRLLLIALKLYRGFVSFWLGPRCRFYPSCSAYSEQALRELGLARGLYYSVRRLLSCHPFHPGGYDPLPTLNKTPDK